MMQKVWHPWIAKWPSEGLSSILSLKTISLNMNDLPPEDDDGSEEDAGAKEATSASIEPLVGHPRAIVAH